MTIRNEPCYPDFFRVRQQFESHEIEDIAQAVRRALDGGQLAEKIQPNQRVAIAVGSRGISNLRPIVAEVVRFVSAAGRATSSSI